MNPASSEQLHHLKMLTRGETTTFIDAEGQEVIAEVVTVDKFRKEIEVSLGDCGLSTIVPVHALKVTGIHNFTFDTFIL